MDGLKKLPHWVWYVAGAGAAIVIIIIVALKGKTASTTSTGTAATLVPASSPTTNTASDSSNAISALEAAMQQQNAAYEGILQTVTNSGAGSTGGANSPQVETVQLGGVGGKPGPGVYSQDVAAFTNPQGTGPAVLIPYGNYEVNGAPISTAESGLGGLLPIQGPGGGQLYALGENEEQFSSVAQSSIPQPASTSSNVA